MYSSAPFEISPLGTYKIVFQKRWSPTRGRFIWEMYTFVTSKDGLTKGEVFHEGGLSKGVLPYNIIIILCSILVMLLTVYVTAHMYVY